MGLVILIKDTIVLLFLNCFIVFLFYLSARARIKRRQYEIVLLCRYIVSARASYKRKKRLYRFIVYQLARRKDSIVLLLLLARSKEEKTVSFYCYPLSFYYYPYQDPDRTCVFVQVV